MEDVNLKVYSVLGCFEVRTNRDCTHRIFIQFVPDFHPGERRFVGEKRDLVPQHLRVSRLDEEWWEALEIAKEWTGIWMRQILLHVLA